MHFSIWKVFVSSWFFFMAMAEESSLIRRHRFDDLSASQEASLLQEALPHKTMRANQFWLRILLSFFKEKGILLDLSMCSAETLDDCLKKFYFGLNTKKVKFINAAVTYPHTVPFNATSLLSRDRSTSGSIKNSERATRYSTTC